MNKTWLILASTLLAAPAWAWPPDYEKYRLGFETTLTLDNGSLREERTLTFSRDFDSFELLGSRGSFRVGLSAPFFIGDPLNTNVSLDATLLWTPSAYFTPAELLLRTPTSRLHELLLNSDPEEGGRPTMRVVLPRPLRWNWVPRPFLGGNDRSVEAGLIFNYVSSNGTPFGATNFMVDTVRVDYDIEGAPEPDIWIMWICGMGATGMVYRRRRGAQRKAASA